MCNMTLVCHGYKRSMFGNSHRNIANDCRSYEVAVFVTLDLDIPAVKKHLRTFIHAALNEAVHAIFSLGRDERSDVSSRLVTW